MAFTSSRLGGPQIFMKDLSSGSITRVSKNGGYNTEANLSPDGTLVTYSRMTEYGHRIFVQDMVTGLERQIPAVTSSPPSAPTATSSPSPPAGAAPAAST